MMAVITDDFTGASEIGGIALSMGFTTVIHTQSVCGTDADILIIASDMRSLSPEKAAEKSALLTRELLALGPDMIFKKTDSVLRGNIGPELAAQMSVENKLQALLIPANPLFDRVIIDGVYYVGGMAIAETVFQEGEADQLVSSDVVDILKRRGLAGAVSIAPGDVMGDKGVYVGNTGTSSDLQIWAQRLNDHIVPAGASGFFSGILKNRQPDGNISLEADPIRAGSKALYICGSRFPASKEAVSKAEENNACVINMPGEIYFNRKYGTELIDEWASEVSAAFNEYNSIIITVPQMRNHSSLSGVEITRAMAALTRRIMENMALDELMIEGGATAQAVMKALKIDILYPVQTLSPGVTRMQVNRYKGLHVTMKPGSYSWPESIWKANI